MPQIPLPPSASPGQQQARSIPESGVQSTPDAFGANIAEAKFRGASRLMAATEDAAKAEGRLWNTAIGGVVNLVGDQLQKDWKLDAEAKLNDLKIGVEKESENINPTGDGSSVGPAMASFDERAAKLIDESSVPLQANILKQGLQNIRFQHESNLVTREAGALKQARIDNANKLIDGAELEIYKNPGALQAVRDRTLGSIEGSALTPAMKSKMREHAEKRFVNIALEKHMNAGNLGAAQAMLKDDRTVLALGPLDAVRTQARLNKASEAAVEKAEAVEFQRRLLSGEQAIDPQNAEQRKIVDAAFTATGGDRLLADSDPNVPVQIAATAKKYGVVPPAAMSILNGMAVSGSPEQKAYALQTVAMVEASRPGAFEASGAHQRLRSEADDFTFLTSGSQGLGLEPKDAIKRIEESRTPEFKAKAEARKTELGGSRGLMAKRTESELANAFDDSFWGSDPAAGNPRDKAVLMQTYRKAFQEHYVRTGDEDMAVSGAIKDMKRTYGVTRTSGDGAARIVRNPMESRLPAVDGSHEWIKQQAVEVIKEATGKIVDPGSIFFENTRATDVALSRGGISTGNVPPYAVYWEEKDAAGNRSYQTITGKLFQPDIGKAQTDALEKVKTERGKNAAAANAPTGRPVPSSIKERMTSKVEMDDTAKRAKAADDAKAAAPKPSPAAEAAQDKRSTLLDIFGFVGKGGN